MIIGIIADTHDNVANIINAVKVFKERKAELVLHLGDIIAPATIRFFAGVKMKAIKGNCDGDIENTKRLLEGIGGEHLGEKGILEIDGKKIAMTHGNKEAVLNELISCQLYDYVLCGHTHKKEDRTVGKTRIINPGAHYWDGENTIVILDTASGKAEFVRIR